MATHLWPYRFTEVDRFERCQIIVALGNMALPGQFGQKSPDDANAQPAMAVPHDHLSHAEGWRQSPDRDHRKRMPAYRLQHIIRKA
jgi:hypothetical protein